MNEPREDAGAPALAPLRRRLNPVLSRRAGLALGLHGEAGIGKTHTARSLLAVVTCRTYSAAAAAPLAELARVLPRPSRLPRWAAGPLEALVRGEHSETSGVADALAALLASLAPVILHLEDMHEAPSERLELWQQLASNARRGRGVAVLATSRVLPPEPFEPYRLGPLAEAVIGALLEREAGSSLPQDAKAWIYGRAAGNPFFTLEYLRYLMRRGYLWNDRERWRWRAPPKDLMPMTVEALIEQLLEEGLAVATRRDALEAKAVLPLWATKTLWTAVAGLAPPALTAAQRELERLGLLRGDAFAHPLFREVTLRGLSASRKRELSKRALASLTDDAPAAADFVEDAGLEPPEALDLLQQAAEQADRLGRRVQAAHFRAQAVQYAAGEVQGKLALQAADVLQHHDLPETLRLVVLALGTPAAGPETVRFHAHILAHLGRPPEMDALLGELPQNLNEAVSPVSLFITAHNIAGNHQAVLEAWDTHLELHGETSFELLRAVAASAVASGRMELARALVAQGLQAGFAPDLRREFLFIQSLIQFHQADYARAEATLREVLELLEATDAPRLRSTALVNRAAFLRMLGEYEAMDACLEEALRIRQQAGDGKAYAFAQVALAELRIEQGEYALAEDLLLEAIATLELYGLSRFLINTHSIATVLYTAQALPLSKLMAIQHAEKALALARQTENSRIIREILFDASVANTHAGYVQRALELAGEARALAAAAGNSPNDEFRTAWALALALEASGDSVGAEHELRGALRLAEETGVTLDAQKIGLELDRLRVDAASAQKRLAWFESRGLMNGANLVRRYFPDAAGPASPRAADELPPPARLEVLGPMRFMRDGAAEPMRGQKRKELLVRLLEARIAGRFGMSQLELTDALYPDVLEDEAAGTLQQLVFQTRKSLGGTLVIRSGDGYALGAVTSDAEAFLETGDTRLWRGSYLANAGTGDEMVAGALHHALWVKMEELLAVDPAEVARLGRILLEADPYDVEALRLTLRALQAAGNKRAVASFYASGRERLVEVGEALPDSWTSFLEAGQA